MVLKAGAGYREKRQANGEGRGKRRGTAEWGQERPGRAGDERYHEAGAVEGLGLGRS